MDTNTEIMLVQALAKQGKINSTVRSELDALIETMKALHPAFQESFESRLKVISEAHSKQPDARIFDTILKALRPQS